MYRNVSYFFDKDWQGNIALDTWDENGKRVTKIMPHNSHLYYEDPKGTYRSLFGSPLMHKEFKSITERKKWIEKNPTAKVFGCLSPSREFLVQEFAGKQSDVGEFTKHPLKIHYLDIEIAVEDEFPHPRAAKYPVNVMTIYDSFLDQYNVWTYESKFTKADHDNVRYHCFNNEKGMFKDFVRWFVWNRPDVITGWNVEGFDVPYIVNRMKRFFDEEEVAKILSPVACLTRDPTRNVRPYVTTHRGANKPTESFHIDGISVLDYYVMYKHKFGQASMPDHKLNTIAEAELGQKKIDYEGSIKDFARRDFAKFVEYNIQDVRLVHELEKKLKFIELARIMCTIGLCELEAIYKSSPVILGALVLEGKSQGFEIPTVSKDEDEMDYEGAVVFPPKSGVFRCGVSSFDLNSLYPNTMICLNMSPETKVGRILDETPAEYTILRRADGSKVNVPKDKMAKILSQCVRASNNVLFVNPSRKVGFVPALQARMYDDRKKFQRHCDKLENEMAANKDTMRELAPLVETDQSARDRLRALAAKNAELDRDFIVTDCKQKIFKLFLNSLYGQFANKFFAMADVDVAEAITLSGQHIIKNAAGFINKYFRDVYGAQEDRVVSGDTDSAYVVVTEVVMQVLKCTEVPKWTKKNIKLISDELDRFLEKLNDYLFSVTQNDFGSPLRRIEFKRETFCSEGVFLAKKRYVLHILEKGGIIQDKFKYVGVDVKKNELPAATKKFLKHIIEGSMKERWTARKFDDEVRVAWDEFRTRKIDEIAYQKGYGKEKTLVGFLQAEKGTNANAKAALFYNQLLENLNIKHRYEEAMLGDKIRYVYVKPNAYGLKVVGYKDQWPEEFDEFFAVDMKTMFDKTVMKPLARFVDVNGWSGVDYANEALVNVEDL